MGAPTDNDSAAGPAEVHWWVVVGRLAGAPTSSRSRLLAWSRANLSNFELAIWLDRPPRRTPISLAPGVTLSRDRRARARPGSACVGRGGRHGEGDASARARTGVPARAAQASKAGRAGGSQPRTASWLFPRRVAEKKKSVALFQFSLSRRELHHLPKCCGTSGAIRTRHVNPTHGAETRRPSLDSESSCREEMEVVL